jgi:uracil-DNA glycosylase family 4
MFTGDRSGDWLYRALYKAGFATQPESLHARDGLKLHDCYITAAVRCVPPDNKPTLEELRNCRPFLLEEIHLLRRIQVVLGLGRIGFETALSTFKESKLIDFSRKPPFVHGASYQIGNFIFISSYHPSQQNTFTGRLTEEMFDCVFGLARDKLGGRARRLARLGGVQ